MTKSFETWADRLALALHKLAKTQTPFLDDYWQANSYPPRISFNGKDETPFPKQDLSDLYDQVLRADRPEEIAYYKPLRKALDPVRGILRSHPALSRALGTMVGNDEFQVEILNGTSLTWLSILISGLMERASELKKQRFNTASMELGALLDLSISTGKVEVPDNLDLGYDILLFHGPILETGFAISDDLEVKPATEIRDFLDADWVREFLPAQVERRDWRQIGAVVRPFRWRPSFHQKRNFKDNPFTSRPPFENDALQFLELLAVANQSPIVPVAFIQGCVQSTASALLGKMHSHGGMQPGRLLGQRHDPFRNPPRLQTSAIRIANQAYAVRESRAYNQLAPILHRLAEALERNGRFALDDKILDIALSLELVFKPKERGISKALQNAMAGLLAEDDRHAEDIRAAMKHFYDVRSAIVHGSTDARGRRLRAGRQRALTSGFNLTQQALFKLLLKQP